MTDPATLPLVRTIQGTKIGENDFAALIEAGEPVVLKAVVTDLPLVEAGRPGVDAAMACLLRFDAKRSVVSFVGAPHMGGGFVYNDYAPRDAQPARSSGRREAGVARAVRLLRVRPSRARGRPSAAACARRAWGSEDTAA